MAQWQALIISVVVESVAVLFAVMLVFRKHDRHAAWVCVCAIACATLITHPCAWMVNDYFRKTLSFATRTSAIEILVVGAEAMLLAMLTSLSRMQCVAASMAANAASFLGGLWLIRVGLI